MRIAGKHLRYSMEIFAPVYKQSLLPHIQIMKDIQDQLGSMHDDDVWVNWLPKFLEKEEKRVDEYFGNTGPLKRLIPGIEQLIEDRKKSREAAYHAFLDTWETVSLENAWENLRDIINAPVKIETALAYLDEEEIDAPPVGVENSPTEAQDGTDLMGTQPGAKQADQSASEETPPTN